PAVRGFAPHHGRARRLADAAAFVNTRAVEPVDPRWYETFFEGEEWLLLATTRDAERTLAEVEFVASQLPAGARLLDVPCGTGRISVPLSERGFRVAGLDISETVLN